MGAIAITHEQIVAALTLKAKSDLSVTVATHGEILDVNSLTEWVDFEIPTARRTRQRIVGYDQRRLAIVFRVFVKPENQNIYRSKQIAAEITAAFEDSTIPLRDYHAVGEPIVGYLNVYESNADPTTRKQNESVPSGTRTETVTLAAYAQGV